LSVGLLPDPLAVQRAGKREEIILEGGEVSREWREERRESGTHPQITWIKHCWLIIQM